MLECMFFKHKHTLRLETCEDKDEIVVEVRKLVKLLQFLGHLLRSSNIPAWCKHMLSLI